MFFREKVHAWYDFCPWIVLLLDFMMRIDQHRVYASSMFVTPGIHWGRRSRKCQSVYACLMGSSFGKLTLPHTPARQDDNSKCSSAQPRQVIEWRAEVI